MIWLPIAKCAFGIKVDRENEFYLNGKMLELKFLIILSFPKTLLNIHRSDMVNIIIMMRVHVQENWMNNWTMESQNAQRTISQLPKNRNWAKSVWTWNDNEIVAQCLLFIIAGLASVSLPLSMISFELTNNPDVQKSTCHLIPSNFNFSRAFSIFLTRFFWIWMNISYPN